MALHIAKGNTKLNKSGRVVYNFSLLSGHTCPFAKDCLSKAVINDDGTRHIEDGPETQFRCFSASQEIAYINTYRARERNTNEVKALLKTRGPTHLALVLSKRIPPDAQWFRWHVAGDFFSLDYFKAAITLANMRPEVTFYAYTKAIPLWVKMQDAIPANFVLTASRGGTHDALIDKHGLREARVVFSEAEAEELGLEVDTDDTHAMEHGESFALLIHGTQPKGSEAGKALRALRQAER